MAAIQTVSTLPNGPSFDIVESGGYLYVAEGGEVRVYQVGSDAQVCDLTWDSSIGGVPVDDAIYGLTLNGNFLYVVSASKMTLIDISSPVSPRVVSVVKNPYPYTVMRDVVVIGKQRTSR